MARVVVDASVVIALDAADAHHSAAMAALSSHTHDDVRLPASALAESLVGAARAGVTAAVLERIRMHVTVEPLTEEIAIAAAGLRAGHSIGLADALVLATADAIDADVVLTTDRRWRNFPRVQVV